MNITCPACHAEMREVEFGGIKVDLCESGCRGLWFDWFELQKFDEARESAGAELSAASPGTGVTGRADRLACPRCANVVLRPRFFTPKRQVEIDECPMCGGIWLDAGELAMIRNQFKTATDREGYIRDFVASRVDAGLKEPMQEARQARERAEESHKYLTLLRLILP